MTLVLCGILLAHEAMAAPLAARPAAMPLADGFRRLTAPETGRRVVQLTGGEGFCYPLYYYIPSITADARHLVYHRAQRGEVQLFRLDLRTAESRQLTHATCADTQWRPWCIDSGRGVLDHRSVLNVARNLVLYFDGPQARSVHLQTLVDRPLFVLPADREAIGQNCVTPDGQWLVYIHAPRGSVWGKPCHGAAVVAYRFDTAEQRVLCRVDSAIFHVVAYDNEHIVITPPADHPGMMMTTLSRGGCVELREGDPGVRGHLIHCLMTRRGIAYEVPDARLSGLYDPLTRGRFEFCLPREFQYNHTGWDPEGRLWFYENSTAHDKFDTHDLYALVALDRRQGDHWLRLTGNWPTFGGGQKAHFHPQLTPDRRWILFTGGDPASRSNHLFLLDVSDLDDSRGISPELLSPTGAHDCPPGRLL
jgi:hypothetical protein